jgi:hypothetical protein
MAVRSVCRWQAQNRPLLGIKPVSRMVARRSKIRQDFAVKRIWLISAIPTATNSVHFIGRRLPEQQSRVAQRGAAREAVPLRSSYKSAASAGTTGSIGSGPSFLTLPTFLSTRQKRSASSGADRGSPITSPLASPSHSGQSAFSTTDEQVQLLRFIGFGQSRNIRPLYLLICKRSVESASATALCRGSRRRCSLTQSAQPGCLCNLGCAIVHTARRTL